MPYTLTYSTHSHKLVYVNELYLHVAQVADFILFSKRYDMNRMTTWLSGLLLSVFSGEFNSRAVSTFSSRIFRRTQPT